jgi:iron(II)-dependent oxidoreductase
MSLCEDLVDARARTLELALDLDDAQWMGPALATVNPLRWELGHVAWFQEHWAVCHRLGLMPLRVDGDALYDSARVAHDTRWNLALPDRAGTLQYLEQTLERTLASIHDLESRDAYFARLALSHEDMHGEAFTYTRQTLAYRAPRFALAIDAPQKGGPLPGDVDVPAARFDLGATAEEPFVFDNEKWAHAVDVAAFRIARAPVTNEEYARFVDARGYETREHWSDDGWTWRARVGATSPAYWARDGGELRVRRYDRSQALAPHEPVVHVSWYEADAYCRWAKRRLPTEAEWELAASTPEKRRFPWSAPRGEGARDARPTAAHANLDGRYGGPVDVGAFAAGDSFYGCRQMIGNVWEWTASDFVPYPGFVVDPYKEYSEPWFATPHKVLRGGCWATRARLLRNTWRNFYSPDRRDVLAGFRTCAA